MGHSVVRNLEKHRLMNDTAIERSLNLMYMTYLIHHDRHKDSKGLRKLFDYWRSVKRDLTDGCNDISFDSYFNYEDVEEAAQINALVRETQKLLSNCGSTLSGELVNMIAGMEPGIYHDISADKARYDLKDFSEILTNIDS